MLRNRLVALFAAAALSLTACAPITAPAGPTPPAGAPSTSASAPSSSDTPAPSPVPAPAPSPTVPVPSPTTSAPAPAPVPVNPKPGSQSLGDPLFPNDGNGGYKVANYSLNLAYEPSSDKVSGTTTITATATQDLSSFSFDFALQASAATVNGAPAKISQANNKLVVTPAAAIANGQPMTVAVTYAGVPSSVKLGGDQVWFRLTDGSGAGSVAEPYYASAWFPCNDEPSQKATFDVSMSVPDGTTAVSNGDLVSSDSAGGRTTWVWHLAQPTATYGTMIAIGKFDLVKSVAPDGKSFVRAYDQGMSSKEMANAKADIERTPEVLAWESSLYGPYPFDTEGGVAIDTKPAQSDAEEYQSRPVYSDSFGSDDITDVVHENAHQWFGDAVTPSTWKDIWLNEGFARYTEWLWDEHTGKKTAAADADADYNQYKSGDKFWSAPPATPTASGVLDDPVYERGAMTLQALRSTVGDAVFFQILQHRVSEHMYGSEDTADFIALANRISGKDLTPLFNTWLYAKARPANPPSHP